MITFGARKGGFQFQIRYDGMYKRSKSSIDERRWIRRYWQTTQFNNQSQNNLKTNMPDLQLRRNKYASPGGTANRKMHEPKYWVKSATSGALKGQGQKYAFSAKLLDNGTSGRSEGRYNWLVTSALGKLVSSYILIGCPASIARWRS